MLGSLGGRNQSQELYEVREWTLNSAVWEVTYYGTYNSTQYIE